VSCSSVTGYFTRHAVFAHHIYSRFTRKLVFLKITLTSCRYYYRNSARAVFSSTNLFVKIFLSKFCYIGQISLIDLAG